MPDTHGTGGPEAGTAASGPGLVTDELVQLDVGPVAHGGHCVARHEGRVVFVRHALPGEVVLARLLESAPEAAFWRADAVEVLEASPDRVPPPCPLAGPGRCGGCDWQHVDLAAQRRLKADVVTEQLRRIARIDPVPDVVVEGPEGDGLGWRTRVRFTVDGEGRPGLRPHRSHDVIPARQCLIADPGVDRLGVTRHRWPRVGAVEVIVPSTGAPLVVAEPAAGRGAAGLRLPDLPDGTGLATRDEGGLHRVKGRTWVSEDVMIDGAVRSFRVTGTGFWQVHPAAAQTLLDAVLAAAAPRPGERALDLYGGVGLFAAGLAAGVGVTGTVILVEGEPRAAADARRGLHDLDQIRVENGPVARVLARLGAPGGPVGPLPAGPTGSREGTVSGPVSDPVAAPRAAADGSGSVADGWSAPDGGAAADRTAARGGADVVVLDPPRSGAGKEVIGQVVALAPRVVVYVACDPAALARDLATAAVLGYRLTGLRAFDLFPMTQHVECVAVLEPDGPRPAAREVPAAAVRGPRGRPGAARRGRRRS